MSRLKEAGPNEAKPEEVIPLTISRPRDEDQEDRQKPLQFALIARLFSWTRPYARKRNTLFFLVICRSIQLPALAWMIAAIIGGPIKAEPTKGSGTNQGVGLHFGA
jgi:hypothetical protein